MRPTARVRPSLTPQLLPGRGVSPDAPYVRRYWTAAVGPTAVRDLLRLIQAAKDGDSMRRPVTLPLLAATGLVLEHDGAVFVRDRVPPVPGHLMNKLPPALRRELAIRHSRFAIRDSPMASS